MASYIGSPAPYGAFEKQILSLDGVATSYELLYNIGSANSVLVVKNDVLQESGLDFSLANGGHTLVFAVLPLITDRIYLIYLGRELSIPAVAGNVPHRVYAAGNGSSTTFTIPYGPLVESGLLVFADGVLQRFTEDWTLNGGFDVVFNTAPANGVDLDIYVHGIERSDISSVDDGTITGAKFVPGIKIGTSLIPAGNCFVTDLRVDGNLTVNGTTTTVNSANLDIADNEITINSDFVSGVPSENGFLTVKRGASASAQLVWDESVDNWAAGTVGDVQKLIRNTEFQSHTTNFTNPHGVTKTQVGLSNVTNDAQLTRAANDTSTFAFKSASSTQITDNLDLILIEDSNASGIKAKVSAQNILPPLVKGNHTFDGDITFTGVVDIPNLAQDQNSIITAVTTDAVIATALSLAIPDQTLTFFDLYITANLDDVGNKNYWATIRGAVRRNNAGVAVLVGTPIITDDSEGGALYTADVDVDSNNLRIRITGETGETVNWKGTVRYQNNTH